MSVELKRMDVAEEMKRLDELLAGVFSEEEPTKQMHDVDEDVKRAREYLGYTSLAEEEEQLAAIEKRKNDEAEAKQAAMTRGHLAQMEELEIAPYDKASVERYMKSERRKVWLKKCLPRNIAHVGVLHAPLLALGLCIWWAIASGVWQENVASAGAIIAIVFAMLTVACQAVVWVKLYNAAVYGGKHKIALRIWKCAWKDRDISKYHGYVTDEVFLLAEQMKRTMGGYLTVKSLECERKNVQMPPVIADPFLMWQGGDYSYPWAVHTYEYVVAHWDEPGYKVKMAEKL